MPSLFTALYAPVSALMSLHDASHDMKHIARVIRNAETILQHEATLHPDMQYDAALVRCGALLHDVGDRKYAEPGQDGSMMVHDLVLSVVEDPTASDSRAVATRLQALVSGVSYSSEMRDPEAVRELVARMPELAIVQDADRLDSIGAVGIGRSFTYSGAHGKRMQATCDIIDGRLLKVKEWMKTETGKGMAEERTERLRVFRRWWEEEVGGDGFDIA